ncbi:helicase-exonuclease AddAB subunit AddA [Peribacillus deserti]|uniref:ATP-dependent helicase/nuclease subunit A n=1 Tax=Peribacillus deserti TaxID=673318 RepID=A0A2N5M005_9BACI|nr:helicase-exonuclease AddAB subunit AddA [Peribacillus deserti]PLT27707.1 helicase-exonuclease AddAB subunit AddA [Peribacillus deserti]
MAKIVIPEKPSDVTWTDSQWKAIWAKDQDILVAAAAGSGKTAVLVNRIIQKLLSDEDPLNIDELLVVTFTNASAAEMRHRIAEALEAAIQENHDSQHIRKQLSLINRASISTLHSFCLEVIRKYYYLIDVDPGFRIADSTEAEIMKDEAMEEVFEEHYSEKDNERFFKVVDAYSNDRSDAALQDIIRSLYEFSMSHPDPGRWLSSLIELYNVGELQFIDDLPFMNHLKMDITLKLQAARDLLDEAMKLTKQPGGPAPRAENFLEDMAVVENLQKSENWADLYQAMQTVSFGTLKRCSGADFNKDLVDEAKKYRDRAKKVLEDLKKELFSRKPESFLRDMNELMGYAETMVELVKEFAVKFSDAKKEKGLVDFSDLEHFCLDILIERDDLGNIVPSTPAKEYREKFKEVLVDEYQDTNMVQETILNLVTSDGEYTGNLFMVGDVKQSIYRFRLAEPNLFLQKYSRFTQDGIDSGLKIDLNQNFRSRREVLDGTNFLFKQIMGIMVGEIEYDEAAELKKGASYPEEELYPVNLYLIDKSKEEHSPNADEKNTAEDREAEFAGEELDKAQGEARLMAKLIKEMIDEKRPVYDAKTKTHRNVTYKDMVILLRSMPWAGQIMEEFKKQGIPIHANLSTGYFEATEIAIMMSLLKIIDNPLQDIPLASVLRSPIVGLDEEELAEIRLYAKGAPFYEALTAFCRDGGQETEAGMYDKAARFHTQLSRWRRMARQGSLSELIWQLFSDTKFYDFAGGMPGGRQRQANLRALYDRARQYESSSFRGLFRFLRFIERMQERGSDLGAARALGEQEDVVRIMTIHSSKGLEFPVVFVAGLSKEFNLMDLRKNYLLDKDLGFASKYVNPELQITYPSLPQIAFKKKKHLETIAEEMRVLYVALTRAKEKLYLIGTLKDAGKSLKDWSGHLSHKEWLLKDYVRANAKSYLDWVGPAMVRHNNFQELVPEYGKAQQKEIGEHPSSWSIKLISAEELQAPEEAADEQENWLEAVKNTQPVPVGTEFSSEVKRQLEWDYSYKPASIFRSKQSVSELKRQLETRDAETSTDLIDKYQKPYLTRPRFMQEKSISPAERGTIMHLVMQHINLGETVTIEMINEKVHELIQRELLTEDQASAVNPSMITEFFSTDAGKRLQRAQMVLREVPFNLSIPAKEVYREWEDGDEQILVQGVIDCIFEDEQGTVLLDYKTDTIEGKFYNGFEGAKDILAERYRTQIAFYTRAVEQILQKSVQERYLFFFDGAHLLKI